MFMIKHPRTGGQLMEHICILHTSKWNHLELKEKERKSERKEYTSNQQCRFSFYQVIFLVAFVCARSILSSFYLYFLCVWYFFFIIIVVIFLVLISWCCVVKRHVHCTRAIVVIMLGFGDFFVVFSLSVLLWKWAARVTYIDYCHRMPGYGRDSFSYTITLR